MAYNLEEPTMATDVVTQIRKATRRKFTAEEKIPVSSSSNVTADTEVVVRWNLICV